METEASKEEEEKKKEVANQEEEDNKKEAAKQEEEDEEYLTKAYKNDNPRLDDYLQMALKWAEQKQHAKEEMAEYLEKLTTLPEKVAAVKENASAVTALGCLLAEKAARASKKEAKVAFYEYAAVCFHRGAQLKDSAAMRNLGTLYSEGHHPEGHDLQKARAWFRAAMDAGFDESYQDFLDCGGFLEYDPIALRERLRGEFGVYC